MCEIRIRFTKHDIISSKDDPLVFFSLLLADWGIGLTISSFINLQNELYTYWVFPFLFMVFSVLVCREPNEKVGLVA